MERKLLQQWMATPSGAEAMSQPVVRSRADATEIDGVADYGYQTPGGHLAIMDIIEAAMAWAFDQAIAAHQGR